MIGNSKLIKLKNNKNATLSEQFQHVLSVYTFHFNVSALYFTYENYRGFIYFLEYQY